MVQGRTLGDWGGDPLGGSDLEMTLQNKFVSACVQYRGGCEIVCVCVCVCVCVRACVCVCVCWWCALQLRSGGASGSAAPSSPKRSFAQTDGFEYSQRNWSRHDSSPG